ncbi:MAG: hypothetical protein N3D20_03025 [Candidatus Pacearchaeota archaeon]|nr:hypothetical protein [Candidatus Pacearchaeota archaeon]
MRLTWRIWLLIILLLLSVIAIKPSFESGVIVKSVEKNSTIFEEGLRVGEIIQKINDDKITNKEEYTKVIEKIFAENGTKRIDIFGKKNKYTIFVDEPPKIIVEDVPATKLQTGLDLRGGARALVQPEGEINDEGLNNLIDVSRNRFNVYGLSDMQVRGVRDLSGNRFMLIEVAGASPSDLEELISKQGKFEAKIGNISVFKGEKNDISSVCKTDATCAGITGCQPTQEGYVCSFRFVIYLTEEAAKKHAEITKNLSLDETGKYLSEKLYLFVDDVLVDELFIGADLRGQVTTQVAIQGSGSGKTNQEALADAKANMNKLQTILITGSLPYKLNIVKLDTISPLLGEEFVYWILIAGAASMIAIAIIIFIRYRRIKASLALVFTSFSEILIILGIAAVIRWNLDLPSIAGILATIGTGVDQQIVILDEARSSGVTLSLKEKMKRALFVVIGAYFTAMVSLIPLYWAVAGLFKGFALTTLIGITVGVFITRPAFSDMIKKFEGE